MKRSILTLAFVGSLAMVMIGCGGDDDKKEINIEDVVLDYGVTGTYDLSKYIVPTQNQINNYVEKTYINDKGERKYNVTPDKEIDVSYSYEVNSTAITEIESLDNDKIIYSLLDNKINLTDFNNTAFNTGVVRHADVGDNIYKVIATFSEDGISFNATELCKINKHYDSKEVRNQTYNNVLEVTCTGSAEADSSIFTLTSKDYSTSYFSYGDGLIESNEETCDTTMVNNNTTKECEKETLEIATIN